MGHFGRDSGAGYKSICLCPVSSDGSRIACGNTLSGTDKTGAVLVYHLEYGRFYF